MSTGQLDCPWCGCGWLISCSKCRKAYTYAVVREIDTSLVELGRREVKARGIEASVTEKDIQEWAEAMDDDISRFDIGDIVIYLDGTYFEVGAKDVCFDGYFAHHQFSDLPHAMAVNDAEVLTQILGDRHYWIDRALEGER